MRSVSCFRCNRRRPRPSRSCATPSRSTASRRHSPSRTTTHPTLTLLALGCCPCFVPSMSLSPTVLSGGGANSGAKVITPTAYKHGWLRREPSGPKKGGWRRCFCILWRLPSAAANEPFFLIYYPDRNAHKPDGFISTSSLSLSLLPPRHVVSVRRVLGMIDRWLSVGCVSQASVPVSIACRCHRGRRTKSFCCASTPPAPSVSQSLTSQPCLTLPYMYTVLPLPAAGLSTTCPVCVLVCVLCVLGQRKLWQLAIVRKT